LFFRLRASDGEETAGLDISQHGETAYTDYVAAGSIIHAAAAPHGVPGQERAPATA